MAFKIDVSKIPGFENLTPEQKQAIEGYQIPEPDYSGYVRKEVYDKAAGEAADWKRKHNALLSDEEKKKQQAADEKNALLTRVQELERREKIGGYKSKYLAMKYDEALAEETATALVDGDVEKVFANQQKFLADHDKAYKQQLLGGTPTPPAGGAPAGSVDYAKKAEEAQSRGDDAEAAYYIRLAAQEKQTK